MLLSLVFNSRSKMNRDPASNGLFIVVLGPDGAGKSTITSGLESQLRSGFAGVWRFHWRPHLLPKLGRPRVRLGAGDQVAPPKEPRYGPFLSLARFIYYWFDFVLGYWFRIHRLKSRSMLVIGERYFPDIVVHSGRYGFDLPKSLIRIFGLFVPSPDMTILLRDHPNAIHERKTELSPQTIASQLESYEKEIESWGKPVIVETSTGIEATVDSVARQVLALLSTNAVR